jgi:UDP-N-acetylglucosamine--N-acetylmuramyl-(pentapeptide) pyrophosphoryl-undecaprenol N-acetylglucosamine transferase
MGSIVMTGGGTGGHLAIVRAVKEALVAAEAPTPPLIYIGSTGGQDRHWFGEDPEFARRYFLPSRGVVNQGFAGKIASMGLLARSVMQARSILKEHQAEVVFSVGGYSAAPAAIAALLMRIPLVIHEQNAVPGSLNRILRPYAKAFLSSYDPESPVRAYPIKSVFFDKARVRSEAKTILFLGGSQGAAAINELALALARDLRERGIRILHQAGERHLENVWHAYREQGVEAEVFGFSDRIPDYMARADFAVARAGASTLWELAANGLPTLFVPYPYAAGDHQYHNARFLAERRLAWVLRESELEPGKVLDLLKQDLSIPSRGLIEFTPRDGAREIAALLESYLGTR